jgi:flagellar motor switch protein FliM
MNKDVLSPEELENLLAGAQVPNGKTSGPATGSPPEVKAYDFRRPAPLGRALMRALESLHESCARVFAAALSELVRTKVQVQLTGVDPLSYGDFTCDLDMPTCLNVLQAEPLPGKLILDIQPAILLPIINRMLGGGAEPEPPAVRPLTEIEPRLAARIAGLFMEALKQAWEHVLPVDFSVERVEDDPQRVPIFPAHEAIVLICFELEMGDHRGTIHLCLPYCWLDPVGNKFPPAGATGDKYPAACRDTMDAIGRRLDGSLAEIVVTLAETTISTEDLLGLQVGDIIATETHVQQPARVSVQGVPKFTARPGAYRGRKAVQFEARIPKRD